MLSVDFHTHSFFSRCGIHTHLEILTRARELGMAGVAVTDHGPVLKGRISSPLFDRTSQPLSGIRYLRGMECNLVDRKGTIDVPAEYVRFLDLVLVGIHPNTRQGRRPAEYTRMLLRAMERNRCIDIITHPNDESYPVDFDELAQAARHYGIALELNNSKTMLKKVSDEVTRALVQACKKAGCRLCIDSDMHAIEELGLDTSVRPFLEQEGFPENLWVNHDASTAFAFVEERRVNKM